LLSSTYKLEGSTKIFKEGFYLTVNNKFLVYTLLPIDTYTLTEYSEASASGFINIFPVKVVP
jgi:hypothetical protein